MTYIVHELSIMDGLDRIETKIFDDWDQVKAFAKHSGEYLLTEEDEEDENERAKDLRRAKRMRRQVLSALDALELKEGGTAMIDIDYIRKLDFNFKLIIFRVPEAMRREFVRGEMARHLTRPDPSGGEHYESGVGDLVAKYMFRGGSPAGARRVRKGSR